MKNKIDKYIEIPLSLYKHQNIAERKLTEVLKEVDISFQQFLFLYLINKFTSEIGMATSIDIRKSMGIEMAAVSRLGGRVENLRMIKKKIVMGKVMAFELTEKGQKSLNLALDLFIEKKFTNKNKLNLRNIKTELEKISELF